MAEPGKVEVVTDALRVERKKWIVLADDLLAIRGQVARLTLDPTAFFCGDGLSTDLQPIYENFRRYIEDRLDEGQAEYAEIAAALRRIADDYDGSDEVSAKRLRDYYGTFTSPGEVTD